MNQLVLPIPLNDEASFAHFVWGRNNLLQQELQKTLQGQGERMLYLWGANGSGKSHLLQACCQALQDDSAIYLPLGLLREFGPSLLEGLDEQDLICIDDIEAIAGDASWEEALFHLYNRVRDKEKNRLIISSQFSPQQVPLRLPDLRSRLSWGLVCQVQELSEQEKMHSLQMQAHKRGFELSPSVLQFLLKRCARNMHDLHQLLDRLDSASLKAQRKITIPFIKSILGW
jgi:DnaA family protein